MSQYSLGLHAWYYFQAANLGIRAPPCYYCVDYQQAKSNGGVNLLETDLLSHSKCHNTKTIIRETSCDMTVTVRGPPGRVAEHTAHQTIDHSIRYALQCRESKFSLSGLISAQ